MSGTMEGDRSYTQQWTKLNTSLPFVLALKAIANYGCVHEQLRYS